MNLPLKFHTQIGDGAEGKATLDNLPPSTGGLRTHTEMVKDNTGFVHTSVTTFFSPVININDSDETEKGNDLDDGGWLEMV